MKTGLLIHTNAFMKAIQREKSKMTILEQKCMESIIKGVKILEKIENDLSKLDDILEKMVEQENEQSDKE